ncbi:MAG: hypothetical protein E6L09_12655 [Verrucomicrobia bacterium]|nr:MAG: hypothetical protein E6L09_12655 [Verrucomicrobiota bacterium]
MTRSVAVSGWQERIGIGGMELFWSLEFSPFHEPRGSGAGVPPADGASRPRICRGRDAREDSRDGCPPTAPSLFMVPMRAKYGLRAFHGPGLFTVALLVLLAPVARGQIIEGEVKGFKHAFIDPVSGRRTSLLSGLAATNISNEALLVIQPQIQLFSEDGKTNLTVGSPQCVFNTQTKLVFSAEKLQAASADGRFALEGYGFQYEVVAGSLIISNRAHAVIRKDLLESPASEGARGAIPPALPANAPSAVGQFVQIDSDHLRYQTNCDPQGNLTCGSLTVQFLPTGQTEEGRRVEKILARQDVVIDSPDVHATADQGTYRQATDVLELTGHPTWRLRQFDGRAEELVLNRKTREFRAAGGVEMTVPSGSIGRSGLLFPATGPATSAMPGQGQPTQVRANEFEFRPDLANTNFNLAVFHDRVQVTSERGNLSCGLMTLKVWAPSNRTESVMAERNVVMEQGERRVTGDRTVYTAASDTVEVTGHPVWKMGQSEGSAELLTFDQAKGIYRATGNVGTRLPAGSFGRSAWLFPTNRSELAQASHPTRGRPTPDSSAGETPEAGTAVPLLAAPDSGPAKAVEISSDEFEFQSSPSDANAGAAVYRGNVQVKDAERMQLSCEQLTAKMAPGTNQVDQVVAERGVEINVRESRGERRGRGDKAVYTAGNSEFVLTGDDGIEIAFVDPRVVGSATGAKATYAGGRDVLELTGNPLVVTQYGQMTGDTVAVDRANATLKATGNWKLKLKVKAWEEATTIMPQPPRPIRNAPPGR